MPSQITGIHHVTAICGPAQRNVDFYTRVLGMRLVKRTVNFDDPHTWHLYYGDDAGRPGTIMTTFPWEHALRGKAGKGTVTTTGFTVPIGGVERWMEYFAAEAIDFEAPEERFGRRVLPLVDPDGLRLELVEDNAPSVDGEKLRLGPFFGVTMCVQEPDRSAAFLEEVFGFAKEGEEEGRMRFTAPGDAIGRRVDLYCGASDEIGRMSAGAVHHVAFRVATEADQLEWRDHLVELGFNVSDVRDRQYFKSIYFREPGGVLFEMATDAPGFHADELPDRLGTELKLPPWFEARRPEIEQRLPPIQVQE